MITGNSMSRRAENIATASIFKPVKGKSRHFGGIFQMFSESRQVRMNRNAFRRWRF